MPQHSAQRAAARRRASYCQCRDTLLTVGLLGNTTNCMRQDDATVADPRQKSLNWELGSFEDVLADPRLAEGLTMTISSYAGLVSSSLSGLGDEETAALQEVLIVRMTAGRASVVKLLHDIITHTPLQSDAGFNPDLLNELGDFHASIGSMH